MSHFCDDCDHLHTAADTIAIGRFTPPPTYRAQYVGSPERTTRAAAERDMCRMRASLRPDPEPEGLFE